MITLPQFAMLHSSCILPDFNPAFRVGLAVIENISFLFIIYRNSMKRSTGSRDCNTPNFSLMQFLNAMPRPHVVQIAENGNETRVLSSNTAFYGCRNNGMTQVS